MNNRGCNNFKKCVTDLDNPHQQAISIKSSEDMKSNINKVSSTESYQMKLSHSQHNEDESNFMEKFLIIASVLLIILTVPFSLVFIFVVATHFQRVVILRNGKILKNQAFGPGLVCILPCVDNVKYIDLRIFCYEVPPQEVRHFILDWPSLPKPVEALTKDSLTVSVDAVVFYKIDNPVSAVVNIANYKSSTHFLAATTLRNALGTRNLSEVLVDRPAVSKQVFELMKNVTTNWGVNVVRVEIKDIRLPLQLQKAMATEAESAKLANAKIIVANAEIESIKSLEVATDMLMDNPMCMQLRYLQSLQTISGNNAHTIVFPFSLEQVQQIFRR